MKKYPLLSLSLGLVIALSACNGGTNNTPNQADVDSMVNARVAVIEAQQKAQNDSMINAMAKAKADSMTMGTTPATTAQPATVTTTTTVTPAHTAHPSGVGHTTTTHTNTNHTPDNAVPKSTITPEQKKEQDAKFNER